jgi:DNA-binding NtrC family response regulator
VQGAGPHDYEDSTGGSHWTRAQPGLSDEAVEALKGYSWPGNFRELRNGIEHAVAWSGETTITATYLPPEVVQAGVAKPNSRLSLVSPKPEFDEAAAPRSASSPGLGTLWKEIREIEQRRVLDVVLQCAGNRSQAAKILRISRRTLAAKLPSEDKTSLQRLISSPTGWCFASL